MSRGKIMVFAGVLAAVAVFLALVGAAPLLFKGGNSGAPSSAPAISSGPPSGASPVPPNGFSSIPPQERVIPGAPDTADAAPPAHNGAPVTSLDQVAAIVAATTSAAAPKASLLAIPPVADGEIGLDPAGIATAAGFLAYFNAHAAKGVAFDANRLGAALKDSNGVVLFAPELIDMALAKNDFGAVRGSLVIQKDFANAEIAFVRSIRVTGDAASLAKRTIGTEKLLVNLIDDALAVGTGAMAKSDFVRFYNSFTATIDDAHGKLLVQTGVLAASPRDTWLTRVLKKFGIIASAQTGNTPFGGQIGVPIPCTCSLGYWIIVGQPRPASLFVPFAFLATPLFYEYKSLAPGAWWLGLYDPVAQVPCAQLPFCTPIGFGGSIIMTGTSGLP